MEPPICAVCDECFDPAEGARLSFDPGDDWFCAAHLGEARALVDRPLGDAVVSIRLGEPAHIGERPMSAVPAMVRVRCRPVPVALLVDALVADLPGLLGAVGLAATPEVVSRRKRTWEPMDGAQPPSCPYTDQLIVTATCGDHELTVHHSSAWWNPDDLANSSVTITLRRLRDDGIGQVVASVGGSTSNPAGPEGSVEELYTFLPIGPEDAAMVRFVLDLVGRP